VSELDAAIREGRLLATQDNTRLWLYDGRDRYEAISLDEAN
jgi:hypothetical protein